ncbi:MAG: NHLP bacteriocin system secretion protein [Planctomycetota bacterium]|nr:NHLP bacteriocin system secretion protein [Planctomycetota bacterium]
MSQKNLSKIARAEAVGELSSTEQLDQRLVVIRPASWILLVVGGLIISVAIAWGFFGRVPDEVEGEGIIVPRGTEPISIKSPSGVGGVVEIVVPTQTSVRVGDPLVKLENHELRVQVENASSRVKMLEDQDARLTKAEQEVLDRQKTELDAQLASCKQITEQTRKLSTLTEAELADIQQLVEQRLVPKSQLVTTQQAYFGLLQQITQQETLVAQANQEYFSLVTSTDRDRLNRASALADAREALRSAQVNLDVSTTVLSPVAGEVILHAVDMGSTVAVGSHITSIRPHGEEDAELIARVYVPYGTGRRIRSGMTAWLSLPFAKPSRYGYIEGEVLEVSDFVSDDATAVTLGSQNLATSLEQKMGAIMSITVRIATDDANPTGMKWTTGDGYEHPLEYPALCGAKIIVDTHRPIDLVLPWLKDLLGLDPQVGVLTDAPG